MEYLIELFFGKLLRSGSSKERLNSLSKITDQQSLDIIPLEPLPNVLDALLQISFACGLVFSISILYMGYTDGMNSMKILSSICSLIVAFVSMFLLLKIDSRYFLDMKNCRIIYRYSFIIKLQEKVLTSFSNVVSVELDAKEVGRTAAGSWNYYLVIVTKNLTRIPLTRKSYSPKGLPEMGELIANKIKCSFREGNKKEKFRIMGL